MRLSKFLDYYPEFRKYYEVLKDHLPPLESIFVGGFAELEREGIIPRPMVFGYTIKPNKLFFRFLPPSKSVFIHELIHLCDKGGKYEELYAYNLIELIKLMAEEGIRGNPFRLFDLSIDEIEAVLKEFGFDSIEEFHIAQGLIPPIYEIEAGKLKRAEWATDKEIVVVFISELVAGFKYFRPMREILLKILEHVG